MKVVGRCWAVDHDPVTVIKLLDLKVSSEFLDYRSVKYSWLNLVSSRIPEIGQKRFMIGKIHYTQWFMFFIQAIVRYLSLTYLTYSFIIIIIKTFHHLVLHIDECWKCICHLWKKFFLHLPSVYQKLIFVWLKMGLHTCKITLSSTVMKKKQFRFADMIPSVYNVSKSTIRQ